MGCGASRDKETGVNCPLDHWMEHIGVGDIDVIFGRASPVIAGIEEIRDNTIDKRDELILKTGACVDKDPDLSKCFYSLMWKLSADNGGDIAKADISVNDNGNSPLMNLNGRKNTMDSTANFDHLVKYVTFICTLPKKMQELNDQIQELCKACMTDPTSIIDQIKSQYTGMDAYKAASAISSFTSNCDKIKKCAELSPIIARELYKSIDFVKTVPSIIKDVEKLKTINAIGKECFEKSRTKGNEITWNCILPGDRFGKTPLDGVHAYSSKKESKDHLKSQNKKK